jgi:hypothetical protein
MAERASLGIVGGKRNDEFKDWVARSFEKAKRMMYIPP